MAVAVNDSHATLPDITGLNLYPALKLLQGDLRRAGYTLLGTESARRPVWAITPQGKLLNIQTQRSRKKKCVNNHLRFVGRRFCHGNALSTFHKKLAREPLRHHDVDGAVTTRATNPLHPSAHNPGVKGQIVF
eukprot:3784090-Rhodomonas_salina.1